MAGIYQLRLAVFYEIQCFPHDVRIVPQKMESANNSIHRIGMAYFFRIGNGIADAGMGAGRYNDQALIGTIDHGRVIIQIIVFPYAVAQRMT